jgi:phosphate transport system protein
MYEFHRELNELKTLLNEMGVFALKMLTDAVDALKMIDISLSEEIYERRRKLNDYDRIIEDNALRLIALYQPMAIDLRTIAAILKMGTYLQRIGRYGKDIAKVVAEFADKPHFKKLIAIPRMTEIVAKMIQDCLLAFEKADLSPIEDLTGRDDEVDELRFEIFRECVSYMIEDPKLITPCSHYLLISRYLERCGDHACKMGEKIHYMVTGEHIEIK